jgi:DNA-binding NarL/FixJ family response regulator
MANFLVVEDDAFKSEDIREFLNRSYGASTQVETATAMTTAVEILARADFDAAIVDMSIPSHPLEVGAGSPIPFPSGGLEVIFEIQSLERKARCVILTQYPEIGIGEELVKLEDAQKEILSRFGYLISGCVHYDDQDPERKWEAEVRKAVGNI